MSKIQYLHKCTEMFHHHYEITMEDGMQYNICSYDETTLLIKFTELLHVCNNLFDIEYTTRKCCNFRSKHIWFPDYSYAYLNYHNIYCHMDCTILETIFCTPDLYVFLDYLKEKYANLLLPVKMTRLE